MGRSGVHGVLAIVLTGCTVPINGLTGVAVDEQRHLVVVLGWCGHTAPDGAVIYHLDGNGNEVEDASFDAPALTEGLAFLRVDRPQDGWKLRSGAPSLRANLTYSAFGGTRDNSWSTAGVDFRLTTVSGIKPGQVLLQDPNGRDIVVAEREFNRMSHDPAMVDCG